MNLRKAAIALIASLVALALPAGATAAECPNEALRAEQHSTFLPDCRAYEMVSPLEKSGAQVLAFSEKTFAAADGDAAAFAALSGFGEVQGTSYDTQYLSRRTGLAGTSGWSTHGINPLGKSVDLRPSLIAEEGSTYVNGFTPDLSAGVYLSEAALTDAPNALGVFNLYRVEGLDSKPTAPALLSDSVTPPPYLGTPFQFLLALQSFHPHFVGASADLSHVVFESVLGLTADSSLSGESKLFENVNGAVRLVGRIPAGSETECDDASGPACEPAPSSGAGISAAVGSYAAKMVSADGRRIFFQVPGGEPTSTETEGPIYIREDGTRTVRIAANGKIWDASTDGSRVFFITPEQLVPEDTDGNPDLYMYDANSQTDTLISSGAELATVVLGASADGHSVYFVADGQLVPEAPASSQRGLYLWHEGSLKYIGGLFQSGELEQNSPRTGWRFISTAKRSRVSPDGRHLLFSVNTDTGFKGRGGFAGYEQNGHRELYLYDAETGALRCVSCNPSGAPASADAITEVEENTGGAGKTTKLSEALSADGRHVFFSSPEALVPEDTNKVFDAYEYDAASETVHLLSSGTDPAPSYFLDADPSAKNAFFVTRQRLLGWDSDESYDLYDARSGGGLPEPIPVPAPCSGESCLPAGAAAPALAPTSSTAKGAGNPQPRCPKGSRRVQKHGKTRCLKPPHKKHHHKKHQHHNTNKRTADQSRRASR